MKEEPKSIWRKPLQGPRMMFLGMVLLATALFVVIFSIGWVVSVGTTTGIMVVSLIVSVGIAAATFLGSASLRWLCCARTLRRLFFGLACLATFVFLFYVEENVRGKHAWGKFKSEWEAKGEHFTLTKFAPSQVPDDQNMAMTPIWVETICARMRLKRGQAWYGDKVAALGHTNFVERLSMPLELSVPGLEFTPRIGKWQNAEKTDLTTWQEYYRRVAVITNFFPVAPQPQAPAGDVLLALSRYDGAIEELSQVSKLPFSRFPINYDKEDSAGILLPHLSLLKGCVQTLQLRAIAELQAGHMEKALNDVRLMLRLTDTVCTEPFLISHLVRNAMVRLTLQPVWEGLADHLWTDTHLAALETELAKLDLLADYQLTVRGEVAIWIGIIDRARLLRDRDPSQLFSLLKEFAIFANDSESLSYEMGLAGRCLIRLMPDGWFEQSKLPIALGHLKLLLPPVDLEKRAISTTAVTDVWEQNRLSSYSPFLSEIGPWLKKFVHTQSMVDQAGVACALERHRLSDGKYPETLDALTPRFIKAIPTDVIEGKPLRYQLNPDESYVIYSIGWNATDNGGEKGEDIDNGDWVWHMPAK